MIWFLTIAERIQSIIFTIFPLSPPLFLSVRRFLNFLPWLFSNNLPFNIFHQMSLLFPGQAKILSLILLLYLTLTIKPLNKTLCTF